MVVSAEEEKKSKAETVCSEVFWRGRRLGFYLEKPSRQSGLSRLEGSKETNHADTEGEHSMEGMAYSILSMNME